MIPVYFINGFLESGKTEFINFTIEEDYFKIDELTLIIACEEGEKEYEPEALEGGNAVLELLDGESAFTLKNLSALAAKHNPERIIIEYNGMWNPKDILLPQDWAMEEQITLIDATTFAMYYANMKSRIAEMVRNADVVVFNRCDNIALDELQSFRRSVRAINSFADIVFENAYGEMELGEEELPYDLESDIIVLDEDTYAIWYMDAMERMDRYHGKTVQFLAMVMHQEDFPEGWLIPGRVAMVCCEDDVAFLGFPCKWDGAPLAEGQWVTMTAVMKEEYWFEYEGEGPVLYGVSAEPAEAPAKVMIDIR
ncbi:MAG: GTPase [Peptococcaceae bacterium]|nr:GTPase [Peptococcaceae bacterium]MBO5366323.1 GTPase [Peptococcaceae bacterium]MBP3584983.1 GTPase [Peptococcaceae bacterium]MBQ2860664.1 GTPase [Peptococcaceae bacterium]